MTSADLEADIINKADCQTCELPPPTGDYPAEDIEVDFHDARELLRRAQTVLKYISHEGVLKTVTKRERNICRDIATSITEYLDEVGETYDEWE